MSTTLVLPRMVSFLVSLIVAVFWYWVFYDHLYMLAATYCLSAVVISNVLEPKKKRLAKHFGSIMLLLSALTIFAYAIVNDLS
ncbi:hypothetical protein [Reichenbachiella ulvae]|uniref:Uncharacterized protein n=1 Tax=Reichenbachiella ulvae TaxID=2980104 RepID=A0ABT3CP89_9BACT|nr:hypothetical protein [Reichenbachiella ulvae]MCV9385467.1 hypothetical protein [Reichenbachiella ulvae]